MENFQILANWKEAKNTKDENPRSVDGEKFNAFLRRACCPGNILNWFHIDNPRLYPNQWYFRRFWWFYYTTSGSSIDLFESPSILQMKEWTNLFLNENIFLLPIDFHREIIIESRIEN